jgi:hypothetical protein
MRQPLPDRWHSYDFHKLLIIAREVILTVDNNWTAGPFPSSEVRVRRVLSCPRVKFEHIEIRGSQYETGGQDWLRNPCISDFKYASQALRDIWRNEIRARGDSFLRTEIRSYPFNRPYHRQLDMDLWPPIEWTMIDLFG